MSLFRQRLLAWSHPGFSAHVGEPIEAADRQRLEDTAAYPVRNPLSLRKLVYLDGRQAVLYRFMDEWARRYLRPVPGSEAGAIGAGLFMRPA